MYVGSVDLYRCSLQSVSGRRFVHITSHSRAFRHAAALLCALCVYELIITDGVISRQLLLLLSSSRIPRARHAACLPSTVLVTTLSLSTYLSVTELASRLQ